MATMKLDLREKEREDALCIYLMCRRSGPALKSAISF